MKKNKNLITIKEKIPVCAFLPYLSFLHYFAKGLQQDYINGKRLGVVLTKLTAHALYAALFTAYVSLIVKTWEINPLNSILRQKPKPDTLENRVFSAQEFQYIDDKLYFS